jgi:hypothetical protein
MKRALLGACYVAIDYRWMDGHFDRLPEAANELVRRRVAVIFASGGVVSAVAVRLRPRPFQSSS